MENRRPQIRLSDVTPCLDDQPAFINAQLKDQKYTDKRQVPRVPTPMVHPLLNIAEIGLKIWDAGKQLAEPKLSSQLLKSLNTSREKMQVYVNCQFYINVGEQPALQQVADRSRNLETWSRGRCL